jgi:hypothetical protein
MNKETLNRIEGLVSINALADYKDSMLKIARDLLDEGFDIDDIREFLIKEIKTNIK